MKRFLLVLLSILSLNLSAQVMRVEMTDGTHTSFDINKVAVVDFLESGSTEVDNMQKEAVTGPVSEYGITYAEITGYANTGLATIANSSSIEMGIEIATSSDFLYEGSRYSTNSLTGNKFSVLASRLAPNTEYFYRAYVKAHGIYYNGEVKSFKTKDFENIVNSCEVSNVEFNYEYSYLYWDIYYNNKYSNTKDFSNGEFLVGVIYGYSPDNLNRQAVVYPDYNTNKVSVVVNVVANTTIYYQAATVVDGVCKTFGKVYSYTIPDRFPDAQGDGSLENPFNVSGINKFASQLQADVNSESVYFKGKIVRFREGEEPGNYYGNATFYISDDGEDTNTFYCFRVMAPGNKKWTSDDQLKVGDEVLIYGPVLNYRGTTPETVSNMCHVCTINGIDIEIIVDSHGSGTADDPFNVAGIVKYTNSLPADTNSEEVFFTGFVKSFKDGEEPGNSYGNATFYLTDENGKYDFYCFRVLGKDGVKFTEGAEFPAVGERVTIRGLVVNYKGNTPETVAGKAFIESVEKYDPTKLNGDFENWSDSTPLHWRTQSSAGNATLTQSTDAHSGKYSVEVVGNPTTNKRLAHEEIYLLAGSYTMTFWVKAATSSATCVRPGFVPVEDGKVGSYVYGDYVNDILCDKWIQVTHSFDIPSAGYYSPLIMISKAPGTSALIDDFKLVRGDSIIIQ